MCSVKKSLCSVKKLNVFCTAYILKTKCENKTSRTRTQINRTRAQKEQNTKAKITEHESKNNIAREQK